MKKVYRLLAIVLVVTLLIGISSGFSNDFPDIDVDTIPIANSFSDEKGLDRFGYTYAYHVCTTNSVCYSKYLLSPRCLAFRYDCIHEHPDHLLQITESLMTPSVATNSNVKAYISSTSNNINTISK